MYIWRLFSVIFSVVVWVFFVVWCRTLGVFYRRWRVFWVLVFVCMFMCRFLWV